MLDFLRTFRADDDGAVTVDWVVLTAAIVGLGIVVVSVLGTATVSLSEKISSQLESQTVAGWGD